MELLNLALLVTGALVFGSVLAGLFSARAGLSFLLVFLVVGMLAGEDGPGGIRFDDVRVALWVGSAALGVILLDGGLRTRLATFRTGLRPASCLATLGVVVTAGITGLAASWLLDLPLAAGLLVGAIVGSTDAAAVFSLLKSSGLRVSERLSSTLEIESGLNDPMAVFLVLTLCAALTQPEGLGAGEVARMFATNSWGSFAEVTAAVTYPRMRSVRSRPGGGSRQPDFGGAGWLGGSGFLAVYLFGLVVAHRAHEVVQRSLAAMDGFAWLAQALLFLLLGLLVTPHLLLDTLLPALGVAALLMFVARPLAVALCLAPLRFTRGEIGFVSWVGLRGAVPVVLALFPLLMGVPKARELCCRGRRWCVLLTCSASTCPTPPTNRRRGGCSATSFSTAARRHASCAPSTAWNCPSTRARWRSGSRNVCVARRWWVTGWPGAGRLSRCARWKVRKCCAWGCRWARRADGTPSRPGHRIGAVAAAQAPIHGESPCCRRAWNCCRTCPSSAPCARMRCRSCWSRRAGCAWPRVAISFTSATRRTACTCWSRAARRW